MDRREMLQSLSGTICGSLGLASGSVSLGEVPSDKPDMPVVCRCDKSLTQEQAVRIRKIVREATGRECLVLGYGMSLSEFSPYSVTETFGDYSRTVTFATGEELREYLNGIHPAPEPVLPEGLVTPDEVREAMLDRS